MQGEIPAVPDLYRLAFMPGVFRCPECDFQLSKQTMDVSQGTIGVSASDRETEECPNDGTMMVPVTYREQLAAYESRLFQELDAKDALNKELAALSKALKAVKHPRVYPNWKSVPEICPDCDSHEFISHGVKEMVCYRCTLLQDNDKLLEENAALQRALESCQKPMTGDWKPITEDDLPKIRRARGRRLAARWSIQHRIGWSRRTD